MDLGWGWIHLVNGRWFDIATFGVALVLATIKSLRRRRPFVSQATGIDLLHGIALFPLFMLALSVFSDDVFDAVKNSDRLILAVAGAVALFSVLEDEFSKRSDESF